MNKLMLAIDDTAFPYRKNVCLHLTKPDVRAEPVLKPSPFGSGAPDDVATHFYGTVLHDQGRFRMWYYACHWGKNPDWSPRMMQQVAKSPGWFKGECPLFQGPICYAESADGLTWEKPDLGQVLFKGSRANNALALPHTVVSGALVIRDDADPDSERLYKMVYQYFPDQTVPKIEEYGSMPSVALAVSADGIRWTTTGIPFCNQFVEPSSFFRHQDRYLVHYQVMDQGNGYGAANGSLCGRTGAARFSPDFKHWPDLLAEGFALNEPEDVTKRGMSGAYNQVHLGVGGASFGNVCVGLYGLWHNANFSEAFDRISCDFGLVVSNDGLHFREPVKGARYLKRDDSLVTPVPGYDFNTILCQANGILNVGNETRIYHGRWRNVGGNKIDDALRHYYAEVALATLPRDRWGGFALNPKLSEGAVCSAPVAVSAGGEGLRLNVEGASGMTVSLLDERFAPIPGFESGVVEGDAGLDCGVRWAGRDWRELAGQSVLVQVRLKASGSVSPRLFAMSVG